jgi:chitinase
MWRWAMSVRLVGWVTLITSLGCGGGAGDFPAGPCVTGDIAPCSCPDGTVGIRECVARDVWTTCLCDGDPTESQPVANAGSDQTVSVNDVVTLDGTLSYDPVIVTLAYTWSLTSVPAGSGATLSDEGAAMPTFVADRSGTYVARLVVSNGVRASVPDTVEITAINDPPVADAGSDQNVYRGETVTLDGTGSFDPNGDVITYAWTLSSRPAGSSASLSGATTSSPSFVADAEGSYEVTLVVHDGELESEPAVVTIASFREITNLAYRVIDAEYSNVLDAIVMVSANPNTLHVFDPGGGTGTSVALPTTPTAVSVGPDGVTAAVGHNGHITLVDLEAPSVLATHAVTTDVLDIVLAGNGYAYAFPRVDQWEHIRCINLTNGNETLHTGGTIYAGTRARLHPSGTKIYGANNGLSPSDIERYNITGGTAAYAYDSPYHGTYPMCGNLWMSADGARIYTACGNVFRASDVQAEDMTYNGALADVSRIEHLSHVPGAGKVVLIPGNSWSSTDDDIYVRIHGDEFLGFEEQHRLPSFLTEGGAFLGHGRFVFANGAGTEMYVIIQADPESALLADFGVVTYGL